MAFEAANNVCTVTYADVEAVLAAKCGGCHITGGSGGFQIANGAADLIDVPSNQSNLPYVTPGSPDDSYLWRKVVGTHSEVGGGQKMPLGGDLTQPELDLISAWISGGAQ